MTANQEIKNIIFWYDSMNSEKMMTKILVSFIVLLAKTLNNCQQRQYNNLINK